MNALIINKTETSGNSSIIKINIPRKIGRDLHKVLVTLSYANLWSYIVSHNNRIPRDQRSKVGVLMGFALHLDNSDNHLHEPTCNS